MKKMIAFALALCLALSGCALVPGKSTLPAEETTAGTAATETTGAEITQETSEETTEATTEPEPVYTNPLTGEVMDAPQSKRIFAVTINNLKDAQPRIGVNKADIYMEMFVNGSIVRGLALYTDPSDVPQIGSVRSTRFIFTEIAKHYDLIVAHAGGSDMVLNYISQMGVDGFNIDTSDSTDYSFRDEERTKAHYGWEHVLFARGEGLEAKAIDSGIDVNADPEKDYLLRFREDGTPEGGETAENIDLTLTYHTSKKDCSWVYDKELGQYVYHQYDMEMVDGKTGEKEAYENVIVIFPEIKMNQWGYQVAEFENGGEGYYACGGKIIPITWGCDSESSPFWFKTQDGQTLEMGVGRTFIAISDIGSEMSWS